MSGGWQPRSVLITGGLGAIGRFVTKRMLDAGATRLGLSGTRAVLDGLA